MALPRLGWWHWQIGEVEWLTIELWVRRIRWWCCVGGERCRRSSVMVTVVLCFAAAGVRASVTERELMRGASEGKDVWWPLQHVPNHDVT